MSNGVFDTASALELNPELLTLTPGTPEEYRVTFTATNSSVTT